LSWLNLESILREVKTFATFLGPPMQHKECWPSLAYRQVKWLACQTLNPGNAFPHGLLHIWLHLHAA